MKWSILGGVHARGGEACGYRKRVLGGLWPKSVSRILLDVSASGHQTTRVQTEQASRSKCRAGPSMVWTSNLTQFFHQHCEESKELSP